MAQKKMEKTLQGLMCSGSGVFVTTGATVEVDVKGMKRIMAFVAMPVGATVAPGFYLDETQTNGWVSVPTAGTVTLKRVTTTDSALAFTYIAIGE